MNPANGTAGEKWNLRLYTAGQSPKSLAALDNLKRMCEQHLPGRYTIEVGTARSKGLYVLKSRGMPHSREIREFVVTPRGIELKQVTGKAGKGKRKK